MSDKTGQDAQDPALTITPEDADLLAVA